MKPLILHGHFYQPPRENPWTGTIGPEPGALPFENWNQRIDYECYRANAFGRLMDRHNRIELIVNNFSLLNFDVGPTLLRWLAEHDPSTLARIVEADRESVRRLGQGNAIAQSYSHSILPLDNERDRKTQIRWGLAVFRHYFQRDAVALWLPETAVNPAVVDDLIDHGMQYMILAPHQAKRVRTLGGAAHGQAEWRSVPAQPLDTGQCYAVRHQARGSRSIAAFFYDAALARAIGFGDALKDSEQLGRTLADAAGRSDVVHAAVDGETFGHHRAWGDRVLAHGLSVRAPEVDFALSNYMAQLTAKPPSLEADLALGAGDRGSSWSCAHGVERWRSDCGCRVDVQTATSQAWRAPLREALELLREQGAEFFESQGRMLLLDPWAARDAYIELILRPGRRRSWLGHYGCPGLAKAEAECALQLLEFQHRLLLMFTSCGWFFDDIGGIESRVVLRHAARAIELWEQLGGAPPIARFLEILREAVSNDPGARNGATIYAHILRTDRQGLRSASASDSGALDREVLRLALERTLIASMRAGAWEAAEDLLALAQRLHLADQLFRAQEAYLECAAAEDDARVHRIGLGLGFAASFLNALQSAT